MKVFEMENKIRETLGNEEMVKALVGHMWDWEIDEALGYFSMRFDIDRSEHNGSRAALKEEVELFEYILGSELMAYNLTHEMLDQSLENSLELVIEFYNLDI